EIVADFRNVRFNGAVARTRRRLLNEYESERCHGWLQWSRRANATETGRCTPVRTRRETRFNGAVARTRRRQAGAPADGVSARPRFNGAVARTRRRRSSRGQTFPPIRWLQWSRRANATETCLCSPAV